jgi:hypothetical protein
MHSISNQSHALDFGRELQKLHEKRFSTKRMLTERSIHKNTRFRERRRAGEGGRYAGGESQEQPD